MVQFNCTSCNKKLVVPDKYIGKKSRCPKCNNTMIVPKASEHNKESYVVAKDLGRNYIGCDIEEKAIKITNERLNKMQIRPYL